MGTDGRLTTNRRGGQLCAGFQSGRCVESNGDGLCSKDPTKIHQCALFLSFGHGTEQCKQGATRQPKGKRRKKD
eukprot:2365466-Amphidinium_carterae.1